MSTSSQALTNRTVTHVPLALDADPVSFHVPLHHPMLATIVVSLHSGTWANREVVIFSYRDSNELNGKEPAAIITPGTALTGTTLSNLQHQTGLKIGLRGETDEGALRVDVLIAEHAIPGDPESEHRALN